MPDDDERRRRIEAWSRRTLEALCCGCGQLRTVRANDMGRGGSIEAAYDDRARLARAQEHGYRHAELELYWRWLRTLKCSACREWTWHALVFDDSTRNWDVDELTDPPYAPQPFQARDPGDHRGRSA